MKRVCAWCHRPMGETPSNRESRTITHGICEDCLENVLAQMGMPLGEFLDALPQPVLLVDDGVGVVDANAAARTSYPDGDHGDGRLLGDVFECVNARKPGGCGRAVHCSGCTIRHAVEHTFETGEPRLRVPATLTVGSDDEPEEIALYVTTEKVGGRVLLRVERPSPES